MLRYKYKGRKSTSGNKGKHEINKVRKVATKESYKSSSTDDCLARKSLIWLLHVQSKKQILDLQSTDAEKNNTFNELEKEDPKQNIWLQSDSKKTRNIKNKIIKQRNSKHEDINDKDNRNKRCSKIHYSGTVVNSLSSKEKKNQTTSTSPITTDNSFSSSGNITNISQCKLETQQTIMKNNNNLSDRISAEERETIKEKLKTLKPSKYKRFHLILKKIEKKITEDIEKKLKKVLKMPQIKTYFQNTLLATTDEKKTISALMGALMQIIIILESQGIERREKYYSGSKRDEKVDQRQSTCFYVTNQQGHIDSKCSTNTNNENSTSSTNERHFTPEDLKNKHLMKIRKKHQNRDANCKKKSSSELKTQNGVMAGNDYTYNDIDIHLSNIFDSCVSSETSKYRTVRKYKRKSFENKFNFELQSMFRDSSSVITQNHKTYSTNVITNSNTQFLNTQTQNSCSKKDLKVLSLLNEIYNTPNITDDKLNKLSLAVLKNIDCCIEKEDMPYIIVEMNKLVKYSKDIYDQIYNIYKTVNMLERDERNIILMQHLFSKGKYNSNSFESTVPEKDDKISTVLNAEYNTHDTNETETSDKCVGSEKATQTINASPALNTHTCQKGNLSSDDQGTDTVCSNNKHVAINKKGESIMLKSTQFGKFKKIDVTSMPVKQSDDREYLYVSEMKNENMPTFSPKEIYESYFKGGAHKLNIQETETCSLQSKFSQKNNANVIHKTSDFYDVEMTDDSQNYSSDIPDESEKINKMSTNCFINSFNSAFSKNSKPKVFNNKKFDIGRCKSLRCNYGERIRTTCKRKHGIDYESRAPKRQCIKDQENYFCNYCVSQHKSINDIPLVSYQNVNLIRGKKQLSDNFKTRTVESIPNERNDTFMIYSNNNFQDLNDSFRLQSANPLHSNNKLQKETEMLQMHNRGIHVPYVPKYSKFVDEISYVHQSVPRFSYSNASESNRNQTNLVNEHHIKYKTNFTAHKISIPYPYHYKNKSKGILHNQKRKLKLDSGLRHNYATFGKHEGFGDSESLPLRHSCFPHHKVIRELNGIRIIVEDVVGKTSNDEELLQNGKHILNNTFKNTTDQTIYTDSMEQETSCSFSAGKMDKFQSNNLENILYEPVRACKMFEGCHIRDIKTDNSFVHMKDNTKFRKPQILETKIIQRDQHFEKQTEPQKHNALKHGLIESEAELCCVTNTSSMETTNSTHECTNQNNISNTYIVNSYVNNIPDSLNNKGSTQFMVDSDKEKTNLFEKTTKTKEQSNYIKTAIQKDSHQHLKCSDIQPEGCMDRHLLDSNTATPLQVNKDSVKIYLKKDECIEITLNRHSNKNVSIQKLSKISEPEFKKASNFMEPEILGHASISGECLISGKKKFVDSNKGNTKITPITPSKINTRYKIADSENVGKIINCVNHQSSYNSALTLNRYNNDKKVENIPAEMNEAQNINVYYCLADSQNSNSLFHSSLPPTTNKPSYMPLLHCHGNSSLNENENNINNKLFKYVKLPQGICLQENEYYNNKQIQMEKQPSVQSQLQENGSEISLFYDSSQSEPIGNEKYTLYNKSIHLFTKKLIYLKFV